MFLNGRVCRVEPCHEQPGSILWENVHITWKTRWMRALCQFIIVLALIVGGFLLISFLNVLTPPLNNDNIDTSSYDSTTILSVTDPRIQESWCLKNSDISTSTSTSLTSVC